MMILITMEWAMLLFCVVLIRTAVAAATAVAVMVAALIAVAFIAFAFIAVVFMVAAFIVVMFMVAAFIAVMFMAAAFIAVMFTAAAFFAVVFMMVTMALAAIRTTALLPTRCITFFFFLVGFLTSVSCAVSELYGAVLDGHVGLQELVKRVVARRRRLAVEREAHGLPVWVLLVTEAAVRSVVVVVSRQVTPDLGTSISGLKNIMYYFILSLRIGQINIT